jgi:hypothetical protein
LSNWQSSNSEVVVGILSRVESEAAQDERLRLEQRMLDTLYFDTIEERRSKVPEAHAKTFNWIFENSSEKAHSWANFRLWLQSQNSTLPDSCGIYWFSGKPGSGKSTLMRYLYEDSRTQIHLRRWAGSMPLVLASCFFWNPGTKIQKSQEGLLRSLLYQLLQQCNGLFPYVAPERWRAYALGSNQFNTWTDAELLQAFHNLILHSSDIKFCLFIDGLDEFEGNDTQRKSLVDLFKYLARSENIKVCLSSRTWLVFKDAFESNAMLLLEDLTRDDIRRYVEDKLQMNSRFQELCQNDNRCSQFVSEIVGKAKGVFLWVYLVVASLLEGLSNEDDIADLLRRLSDIPADLNPYFRQILSTIDPFYREQSTHMLHVALRSHSTLSLLTLSFTNEENPDFGLALPVSRLPEEDIDRKNQSMMRRLNSRCKGLLEAQKTGAEKSFYLYTVTFLHRTVKEFLLTTEMQNLLDTHCVNSFDVDNFLCQSLLAQIKFINLESHLPHRKIILKDVCRLVDGFFESAKCIESNKKAPPTKLLDELELTIKRHRDWVVEPLRREFPKGGHTLEAWRLWEKVENPVLRLAIQADLQLYVTEKLESRPWPRYKAHDPPLLVSALCRQETLSTSYEPNASLIRVLLVSGADPNEKFDSWTVWKHYLNYLRRLDSPVDRESSWCRVAELLILHGAARQFVWTTDQMAFTGRVHRHTEVEKIEPVLQKVFTPDAAECLILLMDAQKSKTAKARSGIRRFFHR